MTGFDESNWADPNFSDEYLEKADIYVVDRKRIVSIVRSYLVFFLAGREGLRAADLGCGDGVMAECVLDALPDSSVVCLDGSSAMLEKARTRLAGKCGATFLKVTFQELIGRGLPAGDFDLVISSLAIHHLTRQEKRLLYGRIYEALAPGGHFLNVDLVLGDSEKLEEWYMELWREWIEERKRLFGIEEDIYGEVRRRYKESRDNRPDPLGVQLEMLEDAGYANVSVHYKFGIFTIFGGEKPQA